MVWGSSPESGSVGMIINSATPSAKPSAVSIDSVSRRSMPSFITSRSTTTEMLCIS